LRIFLFDLRKFIYTKQKKPTKKTEFIMIKETALIEAILYLETEPLNEAAISRISGFAKETVELALEELENRYSSEESGVEISRIGGGIIISPKKEHWETLKERYGKKNEGRLSRAAMETLSIIAYSQPITRSEIEAIRGVQADNMIHLLLEKELVKETGKKDVPGKPTQYGTTKEFLTLFRLESIADLPKLGEREAERFEEE
jgi:segregation and condensation protein B